MLPTNQRERSPKMTDDSKRHHLGKRLSDFITGRARDKTALRPVTRSMTIMMLMSIMARLGLPDAFVMVVMVMAFRDLNFHSLRLPPTGMWMVSTATQQRMKRYGSRRQEVDEILDHGIRRNLQLQAL